MKLNLKTFNLIGHGLKMGFGWRSYALIDLWPKSALAFERPDWRSNSNSGIRTPRQKAKPHLLWPFQCLAESSNTQTKISQINSLRVRIPHMGVWMPRPKWPKMVLCSRTVRTPYRAFELPAAGQPFLTQKLPKLNQNTNNSPYSLRAQRYTQMGGNISKWEEDNK